jgi:hypothetical protein
MIPPSVFRRSPADLPGSSRRTRCPPPVRWSSATRCKGAAKSIRFPARHAQAFDDYHLSLPRVELDKLNQPDVRRLKPARLPCRNRFLGIETVPISPMLHQLRARVEKRRRSVAHVEFRSRGGSRDSQICCGLAPAPSFWRAICSIPSFGIAKFAAARLAWRYQQKYQQSGPLQWAYAWIFNPSRQFSGEIRNRTSALSCCYCCSFFRGAPGRQSLSTITI